MKENKAGIRGVPCVFRFGEGVASLQGVVRECCLEEATFQCQTQSLCLPWAGWALGVSQIPKPSLPPRVGAKGTQKRPLAKSRGGYRSLELLFTTAMIGLLLRGERRRLLCAPRTWLIVAGRLAPTDHGRQGLLCTPSPSAGRAQRASPISPPIFRVD